MAATLAFNPTLFRAAKSCLPTLHAKQHDFMRVPPIVAYSKRWLYPDKGRFELKAPRIKNFLALEKECVGCPQMEVALVGAKLWNRHGADFVNAHVPVIVIVSAGPRSLVLIAPWRVCINRPELGSRGNEFAQVSANPRVALGWLCAVLWGVDISQFQNGSGGKFPLKNIGTGDVFAEYRLRHLGDPLPTGGLNLGDAQNW